MTGHRIRLAGLVAALPLVGVVVAVPAQAATSVVLARAPYVTDLTSTSASVNWATETTQAVGSVIVQPQTGGKCSTITWSTSKSPIPTPKTDPLNGGQTPWTLPKVGNTTEWQASVPVTGLSAGTTYCYATFPSDTSAYKQLWATQAFTTLATTTANVTFDVTADTGEIKCVQNVACPSNLNAGERAIYQGIGNSGAQFLLLAGDVSYSDGAESDYGDLNQVPSTTYPEMSNIFGPNYFPEANGIPTFVADGNHGQNVNDLWTWPQPTTVAASNGTYAMQAPGNVDGVKTSGTDPADWYAIQDGQVRIYVLDASWADGNVGTATGSECPGNPPTTDCKQYQVDGDEHWQTSSPEYKWLKADLAAHPGGVKMAVFHYPLQSVSNTQPTDPYLSGLESLLASGGVKIAFNGHAHTYQRFVPDNGGVANFVTGGGGGVLEPVDGNTDKHGACAAAVTQNNVYALGWSPAAPGNPTSGKGSACSTSGNVPKPTSADEVYNFLKVSVVGNTVTVAAFNATGSNTPFDSYSFTY